MTNRLQTGIHLLVFVILSIIAVSTKGTGGAGDSLTHFFISEISWQDPSYLLYSWGKPIFTLLSSPWAQFGFDGMEIFNILCGTLASFFTCLVALQLKKSWSWAIPFIAFVAPAFYTYLFTGLTEPLAALMTIASVWLCLSGRVAWGFILASFLPFCREEARVFLLFFAVFAMLNGHWKKIPLLFTGFIVYSLAAWIGLGDPLFFVSSVYGMTNSPYGHGEWYHYLDRLQIMLGIPGIVMAALGLIQFALRALKRKGPEWRKEIWLVHGIFFVLLFGHSLVWALGAMASAGLERTLITVFPLLWLIMLDGLMLVRDLSQKVMPKAQWVLPVIIMGLQLVNTLTRPVSKYYWNAHLHRHAENKFMDENIVPYIQDQFPDAEHFVVNKPYTALALGYNLKDSEHISEWNLYREKHWPPNVVFIYDPRFAGLHYGVKPEDISNDGKLREVKTWEAPNDWVYTVFVPVDQE